MWKPNRCARCGCVATIQCHHVVPKRYNRVLRDKDIIKMIAKLEDESIDIFVEEKNILIGLCQSCHCKIEKKIIDAEVENKKKSGFDSLTNRRCVKLVVEFLQSSSNEKKVVKVS